MGKKIRRKNTKITTSGKINCTKPKAKNSSFSTTHKPYVELEHLNGRPKKCVHGA
jgi:hypothetical protein